jgi:uncharacterized protein (DUF433 family)
MATIDSGSAVGDPKAPIYLLSDVARYARLRPSTARYWLLSIPGREPSRPPGEGLSFLDLVSLLIMRELRRMGVSSRAVGRAEAYLTGELGAYPFARGVIWTDGAHVLFNPQGPLVTDVPDYELTSADKWGQLAFVEAIRQYLHYVKYSEDEEAIAVAWYPNDGVELNPRRQFGQPCVRGTRVATRALYLLHSAGDTDDTIANSSGISQADLGAAFQWERELLQKVA